ncbi:YfhO family protein [Flavobacterium sedimenticola]|uniref:YfhO family protein n=1 Tax=Flavobacterium sedimenticola TaxID=3043286 RepID=A0ABT6XQH0_9FLAO|nr:YfhO family protein [Flavobacterium sedimenticola]MDI9257335.1 YfhO family protein [Flavobacterium sedimenticola]
MKQLQKAYPHLLTILGFIIVSLLYFYPVLQNKKIYQSDIVQYTGMAKEQNVFRAETQTEPFWTNAAFGGMPTYQLGAKYPHDYIGMLDDALRFLPRPADYLFLYFLGFYSLLLVFRTDPLKAFFGALAFGLSTYFIVILGVGHNAKAHAIAYMPMVIAGFILVFKRKYLHGGILTMLAVALEINANHFQMTYYLLLLLLVLSVYFVYRLIQEKEWQSLPKIAGTFAIALVLALGVNATGLMATKEYADFSMRGKNELSFKADGSKNDETASMPREYITEYSYGIGESLNLIAPRLYGGGNSETLGTDSHVYNYMLSYGATESEAQTFTENYAPTYWGDQPIVAAPAYIGAVVFFLSVLALYHDRRKVKYAFLAGAIFSLLLSWGKNFTGLTDFFIDYVPFYDKFRAVSSIQVILELCVPVLAVMGLQSFMKESDNRKKSLLYTAATAIGLVALIYVCKGAFSFESAIDARLESMLNQGQDKTFGEGFVSALREDRMDLFKADLLRSGVLMLMAFGILWLFLKEKLASTTAVILVGLIMVGDLFFIDKKYVSNDGRQFRSAREVEQPFEETAADKEILKDTSIFRVYELQGRLLGRTSYFHKAVGGYSAVRPRRYEQLFDYQIDKQLNDLNKSIDPETMTLTADIPVLNALNVKYLLLQTNDGESVAVKNPNANGNAWFVATLKTVNSADEEMKTLGNIDTKNVAVRSKLNDLDNVSLTPKYQKDSVASITVKEYEPNYIKYVSQNSYDGFAVFSENYYTGWKATVDGKETPIYRVNYVQRGIQIPAGKHTVEFTFEPQVVKTGSTIALLSAIAMAFAIIGVVYLEQKRKKNESVK